jgi:hypothetical protein
MKNKLMLLLLLFVFNNSIHLEAQSLEDFSLWFSVRKIHNTEESYPYELNFLFPLIKIKDSIFYEGSSNDTSFTQWSIKDYDHIFIGDSLMLCYWLLNNNEGFVGAIYKKIDTTINMSDIFYK